MTIKILETIFRNLLLTLFFKYFMLEIHFYKPTIIIKILTRKNNSENDYLVLSLIRFCLSKNNITNRIKYEIYIAIPNVYKYRDSSTPIT